MRAILLLSFLMSANAVSASIDASLEALRKTFGHAEANAYRPDLYPTSYDFRQSGIKISATLLAKAAKKIDVFFDAAQPDPVEVLLERYSGRTGWKQLSTSDALFAKHFPLFSTDDRNSFYSCGGVLALVQRDVGLGKLVLWIQTSDYPDLLAQYRRSKKNG
jgi:hypothetical protein